VLDRDRLVEDPAESRTRLTLCQGVLSGRNFGLRSTSISATDVSAFEAYMRDNNVTPRVHTSDEASQEDAAAVDENEPLR
jgi:hypothetical protein